MEAIYFCYKKGINAHKENEKDALKNIFIYVCEKNYVDVLHMLINENQININKKIMYNFDGLYDSYQCTGFMIACDKNYIKIVEILIHRYP